MPDSDVGPDSVGLWDRRGDDRIYGKAQTFILIDDPLRPVSETSAVPDQTFGYGVFGAQGCKANAPWGWFDSFLFGLQGDLPKRERGKFFLDPAGLFLPETEGIVERHGIMEPVSGAYKSNVYLSQTNFERAVRTSPGQSNFECTPVDQMCNVCLGPVRGLPNDLGDELILNTESMCSEDAISFCRNYFEQKEITVP